LGMHVDLEPTGRYRAGDIRHCYADAQLAQELLAFRPAVELESGMQDLVGWLTAQTDVSDDVERAARELEVRGLAR
jgi:dTDP-L-rhamnose 4-epimerase